MKIGVMVLSDSDLLVCGMTALLGSSPEFEVLGAHSDVDGLLTAIPARPVVVVLDDALAFQGHPRGIIARIVTAAPQARIVLLGGQAEGAVVQEFLQAGARGYLYKRDALREVVPSAIRTVLRNRRFLSASASAEYLLTREAGWGEFQVTAETMQVLRMLTEGRQGKQIAEELGMTKAQVYWRLRRLRQYFAVNSNEALVGRAFESGLLP